MRRRSSLPQLRGISLTVCDGARSLQHGSQTSASRAGKVAVVVAESSWGSIVRQLGGDRVDVTRSSTVRTPTRTTTSRRRPTRATWRQPATSSSTDSATTHGRAICCGRQRVGRTHSARDRRRLGLNAGDNPHRWYFPDDVARVDRPDHRRPPVDRSGQRVRTSRGNTIDSSETTLRPYRDLLAQIRATKAGTSVGASESAIEGLTEATGLDLATPTFLLDAISEGNDPDAPDKVTVDRPDRQPGDQGLRLQQPERHAGRAAAGERSAARRTSRSYPSPRHRSRSASPSRTGRSSSWNASQMRWRRHGT